MTYEVPGRAAPDSESTSFHVRRAVRGDAEGLDWIVRHFTPLLSAQAAYRLGPRLALQIGVDDIVSEAWLAVLPKLAGLAPAEGRVTPILLEYLGVTVRRLATKRLIQHARRPSAAPPLEAQDGSEGCCGDVLPARVHTAVSSVLDHELARQVAAAIEGLDDKTREILILRGIEGLSYRAIGDELGEAVNTLAQRYHRAIAALRAALPGSVFAEMHSE